MSRLLTTTVCGTLLTVAVFFPHTAEAQKILGTGTGALLGNDLTDLGSNGVEASYNPPVTLGGFDAEFFASNEPNFNPPNNEGAFNVFDNILGSGQAKWCCGSGPGTDQIVGANFTSTLLPDPNKKYTLTHFTVSSANDVPNRDPRVWQIQGSNDGTNWTTIFSQNNPGAALWTQRLQVIRFDQGDEFALPNPFNRFRMVTSQTGLNSGAFFQLGEIEFFGQESLDTVIDIQNTSQAGDVTIDAFQTIPAGAGGHLVVDTGYFNDEHLGPGAIDNPIALGIRVVGVNGPEQIGIDKDVLNESGLDWSDFHIRIEEDPNAQNPLGVDPIFFEAMDTSIPDAAFDSIMGVGTNELWFDDGSLEIGEEGKFWLGIDIPGPNGFVLDPQSGLLIPVFDFIIFQQASVAVPEPAGIAIWSLLGLVLIGFGYRLRQK